MKFIKINGIKLPPDHKKSDIINAAAKLGRLDQEKICEMKIIRRSIDARKNRVMVNYSVALGIMDHVKTHRSAVIYEEKEAPQVVCGSKPIENRLKTDLS